MIAKIVWRDRATISRLQVTPDQLGNSFGAVMTGDLTFFQCRPYVRLDASESRNPGTLVGGRPGLPATFGPRDHSTSQPSLAGAGSRGSMHFLDGTTDDLCDGQRIYRQCEALHTHVILPSSMLVQSKRWRDFMETKVQVATYTATLTRELCRICRKAGLNDVAYLLQVAASEASKNQVVKHR